MATPQQSDDTRRTLCAFCYGTPHTMKDCPACGTREELESTIRKFNSELHKLRGIIARNALQRLRGEDATEMYVTADDIKDSLDVLSAWQGGVFDRVKPSQSPPLILAGQMPAGKRARLL